MTATPMRLEDALRFNGYTIDRVEIAAFDLVVPEGVIHVPAMLGSALTWRREGQPASGDAFYLDRLPVFDDAYRPVMLSHILDQYSTRRLGYSMPDQFGLAVRRWGNLHLGANSVLNRRYRSAAVDLPLDTISTTYDATRNEESTGTSSNDGTATSGATDTVNSSSESEDTANSTAKAREARSDFPQGQIAGNVDYATNAQDRADEADQTATGTLTAEQQRQADIESASHANGETAGSRDETEHRAEAGRSGVSVMELLAAQREAFINTDMELLDAMDSLFLSVMDRSESDPQGMRVPGYGPLYGSGYGYSPFGW